MYTKEQVDEMLSQVEQEFENALGSIAKSEENIEEENDNSQNNEKNTNDIDIKDFSQKNKLNNSSSEFDDQHQNLIEEYKTPQKIIKEQLLFLRIQSDVKEIVEFLIDNLDDKGYLIDDLEELRISFRKNFNKNVDKDQFLKSLETLQNLDPPGIGARTVSECLLIQSKRLNINDFLFTKCRCTNISINYKQPRRLMHFEFFIFVQRSSHGEQTFDTGNQR